MKKILIIFIICSAICAYAQRPDPCKIYGKIYFHPVRSYADYKIYVEENEAFADMLVYKQSNKFFADRTGQWFITENKMEADYWIYVETQHKPSADFSVYFTDIESFAGCKR
ncbi:MAG: DUF6150 family protein [Cytophagales bacterium]|nr:DUF6150 family protein [Cytophagales bacterium]